MTPDFLPTDTVREPVRLSPPAFWEAVAEGATMAEKCANCRHEWHWGRCQVPKCGCP